MSVGKKTGVQYPFAQGDFNISVASTQILRDALLDRNLDGSYLNRGNPIPPNGDQQPGSVYIDNPQVFSVVDSPNPEDVTNLNGIPLKTTQFLENRFGPETGYGNPLSINIVKLVNDAQLQYVSPNTLQPQGFISSNYTAIEIITSVNSSNGKIITKNGNILDDSILINSSFPYLKDNLGANVAKFQFNISDRGDATLNITTKPGDLIPPKSDYISRLSGVFSPDSPIPGSYFSPTNCRSRSK